jgi:hypothetical protein
MHRERGSRARHHLRLGNPPYGNGPLERTGAPTAVLLLAAFLAARLVQLVGGSLLVWLRSSGFVVLPVGMLVSAIFCWGFDLPLAWLNAALMLPFLAGAYVVYGRASRDPENASIRRGQVGP